MLKQTHQDPYSKLYKISKQIAVLSSINDILGWDQETYIPKDAISLRSLQMETQSCLIHKEKTSAKFKRALANLINLETGEILDSNLSSAQKAALKQWRRDYLQSAKIPSSFVKTFSKTISNSMHAWDHAKKQNAFNQFSPFLEKIVSLSRQKAEYLGYQEHPYDALLDLYEPKTACSFLSPLFQRLQIALTKLLKTIKTQPLIPRAFLSGYFPSATQLQFAHDLLKAMGFNKTMSRLDLSSHPFCMGIHPKDIRMTTCVHENDLLANIFAVIHEGGHGLYSMGLPEEHFGSPLCESISLGIDESQSRFWETLIGHSLPFWEHFYPKLQQLFPENFAKVPLEKFHRAINNVEPSLIRIEADEVTYSLHIIIRFEIEKGLLDGSIKVRDLPEIWNAKMQEYLGLTPPSDAQGCLQDIHWSMGAIGYFPTYTLGNLYASQFFAIFQKQNPDWKNRLATGDLGFIRQWLYQNIHRFGKEFTAKELVERISNEPLKEQFFIDYLTTKYTALYNRHLA